ncbi:MULTISPECIES: hypothetical protein [Sorangium]|uniref:Uncharacterized protein n=1 Tax=Sorangium cellulosum TaxID=56 RepID=A0A4P2R2J8_SORCE|nr:MULTISPECIES: hypothetical protein [Sorangium]AUX37135.1 uncharacterized protein SOCE836_093560 [Sorangium cellulosum]WCQ96425.1 hypothetical protein NQZ70_09211 [Sorangium sp. Soce836]
MRARGARSGGLRGGLLTALCLALGAGGCALPTRITSVDAEVARVQTPAAIDEGLRKLEEAETQRRVARMMASPEIRAAQRQLVAGLIDGTLASLSEEDRAARVDELTAQYARGVVRSAMRGALDEDGRRELQRAAGSLVEASVRQLKESLDEADLGPSVAAAMREQLGPALRAVIAEDLGPGVTSLLGSEEFQRALGKTARVVAREMVAGANDALIEAQQRGERRDDSMLSRIGHLADQGAQLVSTITWLLGAAAVALAVWVTMLLVQRKRYRADIERRARARLLLEAIEATEGKPWSDELLAALEDRFRTDEEAAELTLRRARRRVLGARARANGASGADGDLPRPPPR